MIATLSQSKVRENFTKTKNVMAAISRKGGVCDAIIHRKNEGVLQPSSCPALSPLVRLVEREERWEASDHLWIVFPQNWGGSESNRTVTCVVLKTTANDRRTSSPSPQ
ncbi:hypothetical protein TNCV_2981801 [Trichonephila clavipes]|nr:hypothetical protein TNCV_2981801 [Trichonephila clavipes]